MLGAVLPDNPRVFSFPGLILLLACAACFAPVTSCALEWLPITEADRTAAASAIDPGAGAEILHHVKQIDDSVYGKPFIEEYKRIKVFDEKGVRQLDKIDIPYENRQERIRSIEARVIRPDGSIVEVDKKSFYDREIIKYGSVRVNVRSFSFPALEPGVIAEYKYVKTARANVFALKFDFMSEMPARHVVFRVKPLPLAPGWRTEGFFFRCAEQPLQRGKDGFHYIEMTNLKAFVREPFMPPENDAQPWMLFYPREGFGSASSHWAKLMRTKMADIELRLKKTSPLVRRTAELVARSTSWPGKKSELPPASFPQGAFMLETMLGRLTDYCRTQVVNIDFFVPKGGIDEKIRAKQNRTPDEIIAGKAGTSADIQVLFIALARAIDIDARPAFCSDRSQGTFKMDLPLEHFLPDPMVAVQIGGKWRFFDPARLLVNAGGLRWQNTNTPAIILLRDGVAWQTTPKYPASHSVVRRNGSFVLNDEGALIGSVSLTYRGLAEVEARENFFLKTPETIGEIVREELRQRMPGAEVSRVQVPNGDDFTKPFRLQYEVRVPGYAGRTGMRMILQPFFFSKGAEPFFTAATRTHDVRFDYPRTEDDDVTMTVPTWFRLEEGSSPGSITGANWGSYEVEIALKKSKGAITCKRKFAFSLEGVAAEDYAEVKRLFDVIHRRDSHALTFRQGE